MQVDALAASKPRLDSNKTALANATMSTTTTSNSTKVSPAFDRARPERELHLLTMTPVFMEVGFVGFAASGSSL
jgi:hypothetical protein